MNYLATIIVHSQRRYSKLGCEVRAGLSSLYATSGWVADDFRSASARLCSGLFVSSLFHRPCSALADKGANQTAIYLLFAGLLGRAQGLHFRNRTASDSSLGINSKGVMEASGTSAGPDNGWAYSFDDVHPVQELIKLRGDKVSSVWYLDEHFDGGAFPNFASWRATHKLQGINTTQTR